MRQAATLLLSAASAAALKLPNVIASNMVLARAPLPPRLWGWSTAGDTVEAFLDGEKAGSTKAAADGTWTLDMPTQQASSGHRVSVSDSQDEVILQNIAFGDLYLCSGCTQ